jgi:hypothetical protein
LERMISKAKSRRIYSLILIIHASVAANSPALGKCGN